MSLRELVVQARRELVVQALETQARAGLGRRRRRPCEEGGDIVDAGPGRRRSTSCAVMEQAGRRRSLAAEEQAGRRGSWAAEEHVMCGNGASRAARVLGRGGARPVRRRSKQLGGAGLGLTTGPGDARRRRVEEEGRRRDLYGDLFVTNLKL